MRIALLTGLYFSIVASVWGQAKFSISGRLLDASTQAPLEFANVSILSASDSSLVTGGVSDINGAFMIPVRAGLYVVKVQFVTFKTKLIGGVAVKGSNVRLGTIEVDPSQTELSEVIVQADRTQMQLSLDKKIYNVGKDLSNLGGSASDILSNLPSVTTDVDGNIELRGSSNVRILIDGKPSGLVGLSSTDALKQLQSNLIERVEIITNPSARYDAQGQAGIINIILKKDKQKGINGSFQVNTGVPHNHGAGANMNFRQKWVNFFINYGVNYTRAPGESFTNYEFDDSYSNQQYDRSRGGISNNIRFGADFFVGENSTLTTSFLYRYSNDLNKTDLSIFDYNLDRVLTEYTLREDDEDETDKNIEYSLNYEKTFKREGHKLTANLQYQDNYENEASDIVQSSGGSSQEITDVINQRIDNKQGEERFMLQADYVHPYSLKGKVEFGYRSTFRTIQNDYLVEQKDNEGEFEELGDYTFNFLYREYVHAAYGIVSDQLDRVSWQVGLRAEISDIDADNRNEGEGKKYYNYINFFPSAFLTYKLKGMSQFQLSYSRRISRPNYRDLSPLSSFTNNRSFRVGNPELQPEYTDSYEFGYLQNFDKSSIYYGVYYRHTKDPMQRVRTPADENDVVYSVPQNLGVQNAIGFEINANKDFGKWYRLQGNFNFYQQETLGTYQGESLDAKTVTFSTRISNNFQIKKLFTAQANINYRAPQNQPQGHRESMYSMDLGLSKDIWKNNGTISLSVKDLFNTRKYRFTADAENYSSYSQWQWRKGPLFVLMLNYRLNQKKEMKPKGGEGYENNSGF